MEKPKSFDEALSQGLRHKSQSNRRLHATKRVSRTNKETHSEGINFWTLIGAIRTHPRVFIGMTLILMLLTITGVKFFYTPQYEARALVKIKSSSVLGTENRPANQAIFVKEEILNRLVLEQVITKLKLNEVSDEPSAIQTALSLINIETQKRQKNVDAVIRQLQSKISVTEAGPSSAHSRSSSDVFLISLRGDDPESISEIVNTIINTYLDAKKQYKAEDAKQAFEFLSLRVQEVGSELQVVNEKLNLFKTQHADILSTAPTVASSIQTTKLSLITAQGELADAKSRVREARVSLDGEAEYLVPETTLAQVEAGEAFALNPHETLVQLRNQRAVYASKYSKHHPDLRKVEREIIELEAQIRNGSGNIPVIARTLGRVNSEWQRLRSEVLRASAEEKAAQGRVENLQKEIAHLQSVMNKSPGIMEQLEYMERIRSSLEQEHMELRRRESEARIAAEASATSIGQNLQIIEPAVVPETPVSAPRLLIQLAGLIGSLILAVGIVWVINYFVPTSTKSSMLSGILFYAVSAFGFVLIVGLLAVELINQILVLQ